MRALLLAVLLAGCTSMFPLPFSSPGQPCNVSVDGRLDLAEWREAQRIDLGDDAALWMIQGPEHLCFAVEPGAAGRRAVDVFISDSAGVLHNMRAGAQVGERTLSGARWTDDSPATNWGQTSGWTANAMPQAEADSFEGYEFVVARAPLPRPWRIRVELRDPEGEARDIVWPAQSRRTDIRSWALLP